MVDTWCHHDAGYDYGDGRRTLVSVVVYLSDLAAAVGGATRFVDDGQAGTPVWARDHRGLGRDTDPTRSSPSVRPPPRLGAALRPPAGHDVERWCGPGDRIIVRADVVYEAIPDGRALP